MMKTGKDLLRPGWLRKDIGNCNCSRLSQTVSNVGVPACLPVGRELSRWSVPSRILDLDCVENRETRNLDVGVVGVEPTATRSRTEYSTVELHSVGNGRSSIIPRFRLLVLAESNSAALNVCRSLSSQRSSLPLHSFFSSVS